jgi:hypothetical protein
MGLSTECDLPVRCTLNKGFEKVFNSLIPFVLKKIESHYTRCDGTFSFLTTQRFIRTYRDESQKLTRVF